MVTAIKNDKKRNKEDVSTAKSVLNWLQGVRATFEKDGSIHPNAVNALMRVVTGVHSGRYGWMNKNNPKVPQNYAREEDELNEGMTSSVAKMSATVLKKRVVGYGNRVEGFY